MVICSIMGRTMHQTPGIHNIYFYMCVFFWYSAMWLNFLCGRKCTMKPEEAKWEASQQAWQVAYNRLTITTDREADLASLMWSSHADYPHWSKYCQPLVEKIGILSQLIITLHYQSIYLQVLPKYTQTVWRTGEKIYK